MIQLSIDKNNFNMNVSTKPNLSILISCHTSFTSTYKPLTLKYSTVLPNEISFS